MNHQQKNAISPEHEYLGISKSFAYGLQHVLTMYGGIVAPPLIIGTAAGLSAAQVGMLIAAALFVGGLATLIQTIGTKYLGAKLPLVQGVSFAGVATMVAIITTGGGLPAVYGAVIAASLIGLCLAPYFSKIIRFFPPVVTGCVITIIGLSLLPVAIRWMMGGNNKAPDWGSVENISLALLTLGIVIILNMLPQASIRRLSILLAIVAGTTLAYFMGFGDFSQVSSGAWLQFPHLFAFGLPTFELSAILSMLIVTLVIMTETTADIIAVGDIVGTQVDSKTYRQRCTCRYVFKRYCSYLWFIHAKCFCPKCWTGGNYRHQKPLCRGSRRSHSDYFRSITCYGPPYCGNSYASTWWCGFGLIWVGCSKWNSHFGKN